MENQQPAAAQTVTLRIGGMTCVNCQNRIEKKLKETAGVTSAKVNYRRGTAAVSWDPAALTLDGIKKIVETLDYHILEGKKNPALEAVLPLAAIIFLYALLRVSGLDTLAPVPLAEAGMNYAMLLVIGLVTSLHCAVMCGGINLSQTLREGGAPPYAPAPLRGSSATLPTGGCRMDAAVTMCPAQPGGGVCAASSMPRIRQGGRILGSRLAVLLPSILYNSGRILSYTATGVIAGAAGQVFTVSGRFRGVVQLIAGICMVVMGTNMLGIFPFLRYITPHLPEFFTKKINAGTSSGRGPLIVGLLNGLMPCGPLQAMQVFALSTGSPAAGGAAMFLFGMGTAPLMFGLGALGSLLSGVKGRAFSRRVTKAGAVLVSVMGLAMFTYGWGLSGFSLPKSGGAANGGVSSAAENGVQTVSSVLSGGRYPAITVEQGIPVKWTITAPEGSINGCNSRMIIREYNIEHRFTPGENVIEFVPERTGRFPYSCWMGMIRSSITVVAAGESVSPPPSAETAPVPAGVTIPAENIALAEMREGFQTVTVKLHDEGIEPAVIVFQRGVPAAWIIDNDSLDPGNSSLVFPAYFTRIDMERGENILRLLPEDDFDFSTADSVFFGFVKIVDDLTRVDIEAVKAEAEEYETLIYPDSWFEEP